MNSRTAAVALNNTPLNIATFYGVALNDPAAIAALASFGIALHQPPYKAPPVAPVLYIKTANTLAANHRIGVPKGAEALCLEATLGLVIQRAKPLDNNEAAACTAADVAGLVLIADWTVPHAHLENGYFRPPIAYRNRDHTLGVGEVFAILPENRNAEFLDNLIKSLSITVSIKSAIPEHDATQETKQAEQTVLFNTMTRDANTLLRDVSALFSLCGDANSSDILTLGATFNSPLCSRGDEVILTLCQNDVAIPAVAPLKQSLVDEAAVLLQNKMYVPPLATYTTPTVFCLAINYADHAKELSFTPPTAPLVFLKSYAALSFISAEGAAQTPRPADVTFMHYECELAVVIGKSANDSNTPAKNISRDDAMRYVAGYTVANDFALRDYLENYYRPNLRVKNRDGCTPILAKITPAADTADSSNLRLETRVNGVITQTGNTRDLIFDVPALIVYLSGIMSLREGDIILTGTPDGVVNCAVGDVVDCEIEGVGAVGTVIKSL